MAVLKIRDENGNFIGVQSIKGDKGEDGAIQYTAGENIEITEDNVINCTASGSSGASDYVELTNKPKINNIELTGNKTLDELNIQPKGNYLTSFTESDPTVPSHVKNITQANITNWNNKSEFSGSYNDLTNKPTIPSKTSDITNDSDFTTNNYVNELTQQEIITCVSNTDITKTTTTSGDVTLVESVKRGTKLSVSGGRVVIPSGINQVLVSSSMIYQNNSASALVVQPSIQKYDSTGETTNLATTRAQLPANGTIIISTPLRLCNVVAGDTIALRWWKSTESNVTVSKGENTCLTVIGLKG